VFLIPSGGALVGPSDAATAQPLEEVALGFGSLAGHGAHEVDGSMLNGPVAGGGLLDREALYLHVVLVGRTRWNLKWRFAVIDI
jgi:hypothetical protein